MPLSLLWGRSDGSYPGLFSPPRGTTPSETNDPKPLLPLYCRGSGHSGTSVTNAAGLKTAPTQDATGVAASVHPGTGCGCLPGSPNLERGQLVDQRVPDGLDLRRDDREHGGVDPVELIEAAPGAALGKAREDLPDSLRMPSEPSGPVPPGNGGLAPSKSTNLLSGWVESGPGTALTEFSGNIPRPLVGQLPLGAGQSRLCVCPHGTELGRPSG